MKKSENVSKQIVYTSGEGSDMKNQKMCQQKMCTLLGKGLKNYIIEF